MLRPEENKLAFDPATKVGLELQKYYVNVKEFGAKGDGVTDDTDSIQRAILALKEGSTLFFPQPDNFYKVALKNGESDIFKLTKRNVRIVGPAINGVYLPTIKVVSPSLSESASVFKILTDSLQFENMSIFGGDSGNPKVGTIISTDSVFRPNLVFKNVHVLHSSKKGFDLTTYICTMENCQARFITNQNAEGVGFDVKAEPSGLEGTMLNMTGCFTDYTDIGYKLTNILYSTIRGCGSDHVNEVSYLLDKCKNIELSGIGSEVVKKQVLRLLTCLNVDVSALKVIIDQNRDNTKYLMTLSGCTNCSVKKVQASNLVTKFVEFIYGTLNQVEVPRLSTAGATFIRSWEYTPDFKLEIKPVSSYDFLDEITSAEFYELISNSDSGQTLTNKQILRHVYLDRNYKFSITTPTTFLSQTQAAEKRISGMQGQGSLFFKGKDPNKNLNLLDTGTNNSFVIENNKTEIVFENLTFYSFYQGSSMFTIKNSTVRFRNCVIRTIGSDQSYRASTIFNLENSRVVVEDTTQILGSSDNFYAVRDNNSSIELLKPTGTIPKNYEIKVENPAVIGQTSKFVTETCVVMKSRKSSTGYLIDDVVIIGEGLYRATTSGTSGTTTPQEGQTITDGTVSWKFVAKAPFKELQSGLSLTKDDYVFFDGKGLFRIVVAGTIDSVIDISSSLSIGQVVDISPSGVKGRKVAVTGMTTT